MIKATLLATIAMCAALSTPAFARDPQRTVRVPVAPYDLRTAEGRAALETRVNRAVDAVCGKVSDPQESRKHEAYSCRRDTIPNVRAQLSNLAEPRVRSVTVENVSGGR